MKIPSQWNSEPQLITAATSSPCGEEEISVHQEDLKKPQQEEQQQQPRRIHFATDVVINEIPNREDFSLEEKEAIWFQSNEYTASRSACSMTLSLYKAGMLCSEDLTMRGLEGRLEDATRERHQRRYHALTSVLTEQHRQRMHQYHCEETMADLYHTVSWRSQYAAYTQALAYQQQEESAASTSSSSPPSSPSSNALRKVIAIERNEQPSSTSSCAFEHLQQQQHQEESEGFDINSFFSNLMA